MAEIDSGQILARALKAEGVEFIFTQCVVSLAPFYEGAEAAGIRVIPCRTEQAAAMGADGYARATRRPGVAMFTTRAGFTNGYTGIANAYWFGSPAVFINPLSAFGGSADLEHEIDYLELVRPITKWANICHDIRRLPEHLSVAFRHALNGKPGSTYLGVAEIFSRVEESEVRFPVNSRTKALAYGDSAYVRRAAELLLRAERPAVMAGSGVYWAEASEELEKLARTLQLPVYCNSLARGCVPPGHPSSFSYSRSAAFREADVILAVGLPLDYRVGNGLPPAWGAGAKLIQIDIDPLEVGRQRGADVGIQGSPKAVLQQLLDEVNGRQRKESGWLEKLRQAEARGVERDETLMASDMVPMHPLRVAGEVRKFVGPDDFVIGDGGFFVNFAARVMPIHKPGHWMDPGGHGVLGVGQGLSMGAKLAHPESGVILLAGDGAFGYNGMELETMSRCGINIVTIVGNDGVWGMEKHLPSWQGPDSHWADLNRDSRYDLMAQAFGCHGELVERPEQIGPALERAFASGKPALLNCVLTNETSVYRGTGSGLFDRIRGTRLDRVEGPI